MYDASGAVGKAQAQGAILVEAVEQALPFAGGERGADWMSSGEPGFSDRGETFGAPARQPAGVGFGEDFGEDCWVLRSSGEIGEANRGAIGEIGGVREIGAKADDDRFLMPLQQDAGELGLPGDQIVRPFDRDPRSMERDRFVQGDRSEESQRRRGGIDGAQADKGGDVEIAGRGEPGPALPALAAGLAFGAQPGAFRGAFAGKRGKIVVGGTGFGDSADQNNALAATRVAGPISGIVR